MIRAKAPLAPTERVQSNNFKCTVDQLLEIGEILGDEDVVCHKQLMNGERRIIGTAGISAYEFYTQR